MNEKGIKLLTKELAFAAVLAIELFWGWLWMYAGAERADKGANIEVFYYISSIILAFILFPICYHLFTRADTKRRDHFSRSVERAAEIALIVLLFLLLAKVFLNEPQVFAFSNSYQDPWHLAKSCECLALFIVGGIAAFLSSQYGIQRFAAREVRKLPLKWYYLFLSTLAGIAAYRPNILNAGYDWYHFDAWFQSVYRVLYFQPFSEINAGAYGFYGILLGPFVKILGGDVKATMMCLSILTFSAVLCYCYVLDDLVNNAILKAISALAMVYPLISMWPNIYVQYYPTRIIFPGYILAFMVWKSKRENKLKYEGFGYVLLALAMVWNFETGLACAIAYVGGGISEKLQKEFLTSAAFWKNVLSRAAFFAGTILTALFIVEGYNLMVGGALIKLKDFLFPLVGASSLPQITFYPLDRRANGWMVTCAVIYIMVGYVLLHTSLCKKEIHEENKRLSCVAGMVILLAMLFVYYVNRSAYINQFSVLTIMVIILTYALENLMKEAYTKELAGVGILRGLAVIVCLALISLSTMTVIKFFPVEAARNAKRENVVMETVEADLRKKIPKNTLAIGTGLSSLYADLGWDTGYYGVDLALYFNGGASLPARRAVQKQVLDAKSILIEESLLQRMIAEEPDHLEVWLDAHKAVQTFELCKRKYSYYQLAA